MMGLTGPRLGEGLEGALCKAPSEHRLGLDHLSSSKGRDQPIHQAELDDIDVSVSSDMTDARGLARPSPRSARGCVRRPVISISTGR